MLRDGGPEAVHQWPHIKRFLRVESSGWVEDDFHWWLGIEDRLKPTERAAANEEWADFFEWRLAQRADELADDRIKRYLVAKWTDSMTYCCRRAASHARDEDPGEAIPQHRRRPDLDAEGRTIVAEDYGTAGRASSKMAPASSAL
jgi:hypothetical protein